jgi:DNA invertase Pin-like site-specific DNA recombinase
MTERSSGAPAGDDPDAQYIALEERPLISGVSADARVGAFSGAAFAKQRSDDGSTRYLVLDRRRQRLFWVLESEIDGPPQNAELKAFGYVCAPAEATGDAHAELIGQARAIRRACQRRGLDLIRVVREVEPAGGGDGRPALRRLLEGIASGEACCLVVEALDRLGGSASAVGALVSWFEVDGRRLIAADLDLDTHTLTGKVAVRALTAAGELESRKLAERTRRGLAAARAKGTASGRPSVSDQPELRARIVLMRAEGKTLQAIADELNAEGVPTLRGGALWRPSSVQAAAGYKRPSRARGAEDVPRPGDLRPTGT